MSRLIDSRLPLPITLTLSCVHGPKPDIGVLVSGIERGSRHSTHFFFEAGFLNNPFAASGEDFAMHGGEYKKALIIVIKSNGVSALSLK